MYMCDPSLTTVSFTPSTVIFNTPSREKQVQMSQRRYALVAYLYAYLKLCYVCREYLHVAYNLVRMLGHLC